DVTSPIEQDGEPDDLNNHAALSELAVAGGGATDDPDEPFYNAGDGPALAEYLRHEGGFLDNCGPALRCALLTIDPFARRRYQHLEYAPLINARAHRFANHPTILNNRFAEQWTALLRVLSHKPRLEHDDRLAVAYYLLLQDRTDEGLAIFFFLDREPTAACMLYHYVALFASFLQPGCAPLTRARALA
ncbi:MAG: hypothetical protein KC457_36940, partial [Myxococcales bacterium]|nr:hypothetical protein [Myxococcales bacterium]